MNTIQLHPEADPSATQRDLASESGGDVFIDCILERIQMLRHLATALPKEMGSTYIELHARFMQELGIIDGQVQQAFKYLTQVISTIHDGLSEWESKTDGLIQRTGKQLDKVSITTETATHQILDAVEKVNSAQMNAREKVTELIAHLEQGENPQSPTDSLETLKHLAEELETAQADTFQIMNYLQFQDITAQQIKQAYGLLSEAEEQLIAVASTFKPVSGTETEVQAKPKSIYNSNAEYINAEDKQKQVDALFRK